MNATLDSVPSRHSPSRWRPARRIGLMALLAGTLLLALAGARMFIAGIAAYQAEAFLADWNRSSTTPSEQAWEVAHAAAERALRFYPGDNGDYLDRLGRIHEWHQADLPYGDPAAGASRQAARDAYRASTVLRPEWPYTWVQLAYVKMRLHEFDAEFDQALQRGFETGGWRLQANRWLAEIGLLAWTELNPARHEQVLESIRRTAQLDAGEARNLMALADEVGRGELFCTALGDEVKAGRRLCTGH